MKVTELRESLARLGDGVVRIALETTRNTRERRLADRALRPINPDALASRDEFELTQLGLGDLMEAAEHKIDNDGSLDDLERALQRLSGLLQA